MSAKIDRWVGFCLDTERSREACRSWLGGFARPEDELLLAEGYENDDGTMPRIRVLVRRAETGVLGEVQRRQNKRTWTLKWAAPSAAFLKRAKERGVRL